MPNTGSMTELVGIVAYQLSLIQPLLPTYLHLIVAALFPIYTGAHASLTRPSSAAKPPKKKKDSQDTDDDDAPEEPAQKMEGLSPTDAIMFPVMAGATLAVLYFFIQWLEDAATLNSILNLYFSVFGIFSVTRLLTDTMAVLTSFIFPTRYIDKDRVWHAKGKRMASEKMNGDGRIQIKARHSPLPGIFGRISLPGAMSEAIWILRALPSRKLRVRVFVRSILDTNVRIGVQDYSAFVLAIAAVAYFNLVAKPWWLTNLLGFGFSYGALQIMSPTTFWTGTLILSSLFVYDIYFVFFTPLMVTVATKLDIPIKLLFPRPPAPGADPTKPPYAMLGLGDVVVPGIMIGLALRFDLYLFYLRKQSKTASTNSESEVAKEQNELVIANETRTEADKAPWQPATGSWGERFWTGWSIQTPDGGTFPKTYFHASTCGYIIGMLFTLGIMQISSHPQPALLYLVPAVLVSLWGTALVRGDTKEMWEYTDVTDEDEGNSTDDKTKQQQKTTDSFFSFKRAGKIAESLPSKKVLAEDKKPGDPESLETAAKKREYRREIIAFSISLPPRPRSTETKSELSAQVDSAPPSLEDELRIASQGNLGSASTNSSSYASRSSSPRQRSTVIGDQEPVEKRRRLD